MTRHFAKLAIVAIVGGILFSSPTVAQLLPPAKKAEHVAITQAPTLELALDDFAIVRWTTTNPGGDDEHYGVVHYGTSPTDLSQTAKSHIRLNRAHPETIFRVRIPQLKPPTAYFSVDPFADVGWAIQQLNALRFGYGKEANDFQIHE